MFLIPGHRIYSPQNSSYLSSNFMLISQFSEGIRSIDMKPVLFVKLHSNHAYFLEAAIRFEGVLMSSLGRFNQ